MPNGRVEAHLWWLVRIRRREIHAHLEDPPLAAKSGEINLQCHTTARNTYYDVPSGPTIHNCHARILSSISTSSGIQAKERGDFCMATKSFIKIFLVKESAIPPFLCLLFDGTRDPALGIYMR